MAKKPKRNKKQKSNNEQNLVAKWMMLVIVVVVPLISSVSMTADPWDIWKVTVLRISVTVILAAWLIDAIRRGKLAVIRTPIDLPLLLFLSISLVSTLAAHDRIVSLFGLYLRYEGWTTWLCYGLVLWFAIQLIDDRLWLVRVIRVWMVTAGIMAVYGTLQHFGIDFRSWQAGGAFEVFRSFGTIGNPLGFSAYLAMAFPVFLYSMHKERTGYWRIFLAISLVAVIAAVFFSFSRAGWVAAGVSVLIFTPLLLFILDKTVRWRLLSFGMIAAICLILMLGVLPSGIQGQTSLVHGLKIMSNMSQGSGASRLHLWGLTINEIIKQPVWGHGFDTYKELSSKFIDAEQYRLEPDTLFDRPHSNILQIAFSTGITGAIAYMWILFAALWGLWLAIKRKDDDSFLALALAAGVLAYFIAVQFGFTVVSTAPAFWLAAGLLAGIGYGPDDSRRIINLNLRPNMKIVFIATIIIIAVVISLFSLRPLVADMYFQKARQWRDAPGASIAIKRLDRAIAFYPYCSDYYNMKTQALLYLASSGQGQLDERLAHEAIETLEQSGIKGTQSMQSFLGTAEIYSKLKNPVKTELYARKALDEYGFSKPAISMLAQALTWQQKYEEAKQQWQRLISLSPKDAKGYVGLGFVYYMQEDNAEAKTQFDKALVLDPDNEQVKKALEALEL